MKHLKLMILASDSQSAIEAQKAGIDRIFYDLEYIGKAERQHGRNTVKSNNSIDDIPAVRKVLTTSQLLVRTNPIHAYSKTEIDKAISYGADVLMLPMVMDQHDVEQYVEMVLGYLRLESPSSDYVIRNYALDDIVRQAVRKYASQFIRRKLRLEYTPLNVSVITDEKWLLFVIEQVLSNALKYTRSGSVSITLEAPKTLCIRDTGIGIAPEDLPRVFEKGYTGSNGRTDKRATGIGLYLCRRILAKLGHSITIVSTPGVGTTVRIGLEQDALEVE